MTINGINVMMTAPCLGVMGPSGEKTAVRPTYDGRFVVMTCLMPYRVIKTFTDSLHARRYNARIHGENLGE